MANGSTLCTMNSLQYLSEVPDVDFVLVSILATSDGMYNEEFARSLGMDHVSLRLEGEGNMPGAAEGKRATAVARALLKMLTDKYLFIHESQARRQKHIDLKFRQIVEEKRPDLVVYDHIYPAFYVPSFFRLGVPCALISVNNEVPFHRTTKAQDGPVGEGPLKWIERWICRRGNWLSNWRFESYVNRLFRHCVGIVTLNSDDLPKGLSDSVVRAVIPPILKKSDRHWTYLGTRSIFFVGNIWIYSNRLAVEWICTRFASELWRIDKGIRIDIVGARADQVPNSWSLPNVSFKGYADSGEVHRQMSSADLFIAPIENPFGAKLKMAQCISHLMPFLATHAAMSGLPFREAMPQIDLTQPSDAAQLAAEYINNPRALAELSQLIDARAQEARVRQVEAWGSFLVRCMRIDWSDVPYGVNVAANGAPSEKPSGSTGTST
jgi:hypothetical protein